MQMFILRRLDQIEIEIKEVENEIKVEMKKIAKYCQSVTQEDDLK